MVISRWGVSVGIAVSATIDSSATKKRLPKTKPATRKVQWNGNAPKTT